MIETSRLRLVPATMELARAEMGDRRQLGQLLRAYVPENWPPEAVGDALPTLLTCLEAAPDRVGWFGWYALAATEVVALPVLVGSGGFKGPPHAGEVETGYSVLPQYQGKGYATEMVVGLVRWALKHAEVDRIVAETEWANPASVRVLLKAGFVPDGVAAMEGSVRFLYSRTA